MIMEKVEIGRATLYRGDALEVLEHLTGPIDAIITDPPYSSGGQFRSDRNQSTTAKYVNTDTISRAPDFAGDNRDQRAFLAWAGLLFSRMYRLTAPGAVLYTFTDWRQLPTMSDAVQVGGFVWRNLVTWWKPGVRMQEGRFSGSSEYVLACSHGVPAKGERSLQNVLTHAVVRFDDKTHIAEKPIGLMQDLVSVTPAGCFILDPFMGSGTTGIAAILSGRRFIGIELDRNAFDTAAARIEQAMQQGDLLAQQTEQPALAL